MEKKNFYTTENSCKTFLWALLLPQIVSIVLAVVFSFFYKTQEELANSLIYLFTATILAQGCFAYVLFRYNKKNNINFVKATNLKTKVDVKNILICILISIIAVLGFSNFINMITNFFTQIGFNQTTPSLPINTFYWFFINVLLLAVIPAFFEECIFRGMIFSGLKSRGLWFATIISSVMFALIHLSIKQFVFPIIMGCVFCLVLNKTGSILYTMIIHFCNNFFVLLISYINSCTGKSVLSLNVTSFWSGALVTFIAILSTILILLLIKFALNGNNKNVSETLNSSEISTSNAKDLSNVSNDLTNTDKKSQNKYIIGVIVAGVVVWLVYMISELIG